MEERAFVLVDRTPEVIESLRDSLTERIADHVKTIQKKALGVENVPMKRPMGNRNGSGKKGRA